MQDSGTIFIGFINICQKQIQTYSTNHKSRCDPILNLDEYYMTVHPELRESQEWVDQDSCPACGHHVGKDAKECSDCGLTLIFDLEE